MSKELLKKAAEKLRKTFNLDSVTIESFVAKSQKSKPSLAEILEKSKADDSIITKRPVSQWGTETRDFGGIRNQKAKESSLNEAQLKGDSLVEWAKQRFKSRWGYTAPDDYGPLTIADNLGSEIGSHAEKRLRTLANPSSGITLDESHIPDYYKSHNPHLVVGMMPDTQEFPNDSSLTPGIRIGHHTTDPNLKVIVKPPLSPKEYEMVSYRFEDPRHNHHIDPDFTSTHREVAYHILADKFFGLGKYVPETSAFVHPKNNKLHSVHRFIPNTQPLSISERRDFSSVSNSDLQKMAIMNAILGNNDRHGGNVLVGHDNSFHLIDHGATFDYGEMFHNSVPAYIWNMLREGADIEPPVHQWIDSLKTSAMKNHLARANVPPTLAAIAVNRLKELKSWSKKQRQKQLARKQDHSGKLKQALSMATLHGLNEHGELSAPEKIAQWRKQIEDRGF